MCTEDYFNGTWRKVSLRRRYLSTDLKEERKRIKHVSWGDAFLADGRKGSAFSVKCRGCNGWRK